MSSCLGFVAQSSLAVPLGLESSFLLFESRDIINILLFSVPTVSHGISFSPALRAWAINPSRKNSVLI